MRGPCAPIRLVVDEFDAVLKQEFEGLGAIVGVGTNDQAKLTGNVLEDEKILGTVHVAFGASAGIGGTVSVPIHLDVVVADASLEVDGRRVLEEGRWVLESAADRAAAQ